ncbi:MAG: ABC transporter permease [Chloroflexi bacterium]|nr:ABC transporter permease [Chloroflexota bacterium]
MGIVLLVVACAVLAPFISPYDPNRQQLLKTLQAPSAEHLLGTDENGRDVLSRILYGTSVSLKAGVISVSIALALGVVSGLTSGYFGGRVDNLIMRGMDALLAFPTLVLALAITATLGPGLSNAMIAIGIVYTPIFARLTRGQVLSVREREFVEAARTIGAGHVRIMGRHILPNVIAPLIVQVSLSIALAILAEATLSFLGLGVQPPDPSWGSMVSRGKDYLDMAPWLAFAPGGAILLAVMGFNFLGDAIRDALDPRMARAK